MRAAGQPQTHSFFFYSSIVKDSFEIFVSSTAPLDSETVYSTIYYLDANLKSGNKLRSLLADSSVGKKQSNTLFIGIGHKGDFHTKRCRDFIPPLFNQNVTGDKVNYGHADNFYLFLSKELIPLIEKRYRTNSKRSLTGHSFGGLFAFYALFQKESIFQNFYALSPSLWVNKEDIFKYLNNYKQSPQKPVAYLYMSAGTQETMNHVLKTTRKMYTLLRQEGSLKIVIDYFEHRGKSHNSQVPVSLYYILNNINP